MAIDTNRSQVALVGTCFKFEAAFRPPSAAVLASRCRTADATERIWG